jgi:hypothetical protein
LQRRHDDDEPSHQLPRRRATVDGRGVTYYYAFFSPKHLGEGQFYLMEIANKDSKSFDGGRTYRLNVPANPPVKLYWSATVYDRATHALIREMPWSSRGSNTPGLMKNADGSMDLERWRVRGAVPVLRPRKAAVR